MTDKLTTHVRWLLVFWLFVLSAVSYLDRVNIAIAGDKLRFAYGFTLVQLGWIFSAFPVSYALFQTVGGRLADRLGSRRVLTIGVLWWGVFTALTAALPLRIAGALALLMAIRFSLGAGEAVLYPASSQFVARWIPSCERGIANGWIFAGVGAGAGLSPPLISYVMLHYGWRWSFWVCALVGVAVGAAWYVIARDEPAEHPRVSSSELALIRSGLTLADHGGPKSRDGRPEVVPWAMVLESRCVRAITFSYFCFGYVAWIFFSWFYIYLARVRGLNLKESAFYAMLPFLAMAVCSALGGTLSDRLTRWRGPRFGRCTMASFAMIIAATFLAFGSLVQSARFASVILAGGAGALYLAQSSFWAVTTDIAGASSGSVSGFMNMGGQIGGAVTASLTPWIAVRLGWTASFLVAAALCLVGAVTWLIVDPARTLALRPESHRSTSVSDRSMSRIITTASS